MRRLSVAAVALALVPGCYHGIDADSGAMLSGGSGDTPTGGTGESGDGSDTEAPPPSDPAQVGPTGLRRLTAREFDNTLRDLLQDESFSSSLLLPEDLRTPFDNAYVDQDPSAALIEGVNLLASDAAARLIEAPAKLDAVLGCSPAGPDDAVCFESFVTSFGRRAFRRPLTDAEVTAFMSMQDHAVEDGDFNTGVESVVRSVLQSPSFLYRVERGTPVEGEPDLFRLDNYEVASRLSYFLWGSTPDDALLDLADAGSLQDPDGIRGAAQDMLTDARALDRIVRFHELWMGYESLPVDYELATAMQAETRALMERVIVEEKAPWQDLLRMTETYVDDTLAAHYGLAAPAGGAGWVDYADSGRKGLLSQGSFLSLGSKFGDTSPTQRGLLVRTRLFCQTVDLPPPDEDVNVDQPPGDPAEQCKSERYAAHQVAGTSCNSCHQLVDPIGFGLENYDQTGAFRTHDNGRPECEIDGQGTLTGVGDFSGPAELADLMIDSGLLNRCVATQLYRYTIGRYELGQLDENFLDAVEEQLGEGDFQFEALLLDFVAADMFRFRRQEEE